MYLDFSSHDDLHAVSETFSSCQKYNSSESRLVKTFIDFKTQTKYFASMFWQFFKSSMINLCNLNSFSDKQF